MTRPPLFLLVSGGLTESQALSFSHHLLAFAAAPLRFPEALEFAACP
jgi:hypothetical protein